MKKLLLLLILLTSPASAQDIANHAIPVGGGPGVVGWRTVGPCATSQVIIWAGGAGADPSCGSPTVITALTNGHIYVGSASNLATDVAMSQDCTIVASGAITCLKTNNVAFGTAATQNTGTSGATIPFLNGNNTWGGTNGFQAVTTTTLGSTAITATSVATTAAITAGTTATATTNLLLGGSADTGVSRTVANVVQLNNGTPGTLTGTYLQWGGQARVTSDFSVSNSTTLVNVTGLSVTVAAGRTYSFDVYLPWTANTGANGGVKAAIAGTATATNIIYDGYMLDGDTPRAHATGSSLGATVANSTVSNSPGVIYIKGTITVNAGGTLTVQFAQSTVNVSPASIVKRGAYFLVWDMP